uniref:uncharacterized protein LOC118523379 isoform X2 n=1 Tax=Halichoerus grypus TaxID=9711 RepID=UPI00165905C2|nr:uncharacterized protein LOC118523379 isoform X2 [Halichoerus grypus]
MSPRQIRVPAPPTLPSTGRLRTRWDTVVRRSGRRCREHQHGTGPPTWPCFLPQMVEPARSPALTRPRGQDPALPGNECLRYLASADPYSSVSTKTNSTAKWMTGDEPQGLRATFRMTCPHLPRTRMTDGEKSSLTLESRSCSMRYLSLGISLPPALSLERLQPGSFFPCQGCKGSMPNVGLELTTLKSRVTCSTY